MSASIRNELVNAVVARFQTVRVANGFLTDAGANVFLWRLHPLTPEEMPGIVLRDRRTETRLEGRVVHEHRLYFEADLYAPTGTDPRALLADAQSAVGKDIRWKVGSTILAVDTQPLDDELDASQEERLLRGCRYRFQVIFRTRPFNPFALASPT